MELINDLKILQISDFKWSHTFILLGAQGLLNHSALMIAPKLSWVSFIIQWLMWGTELLFLFQCWGLCFFLPPYSVKSPSGSPSPGFTYLLNFSFLLFFSLWNCKFCSPLLPSDNLKVKKQSTHPNSAWEVKLYWSYCKRNRHLETASDPGSLCPWTQKVSLKVFI